MIHVAQAILCAVRRAFQPLTYRSKRVDDDDVQARWVLNAIVDTASEAEKTLSDA